MVKVTELNFKSLQCSRVSHAIGKHSSPAEFHVLQALAPAPRLLVVACGHHGLHGPPARQHVEVALKREVDLVLAASVLVKAVNSRIACCLHVHTVGVHGSLGSHVQCSKL